MDLQAHETLPYLLLKRLANRQTHLCPLLSRNIHLQAKMSLLSENGHFLLGMVPFNLTIPQLQNVPQPEIFYFIPRNIPSYLQI